MTDAETDREKIVSKLPPQLHRTLKVRAAELETDMQDAVEAGIRLWLAHTGPIEEIDTSGASSFSTWLPPDLHDEFRATCPEREVSLIQGLVQSIQLWLNQNASTESDDPKKIVRRIIVCNQKGGVGKTTITAGIASVLATRGRRVLIVDYDAQGHLSNQLGIPHIKSGDDSLARYMSGESKGDIFELVVTLEGDQYDDRLNILPAGLDGFLLDAKLATTRARENALERALRPLELDYDYIVVDCPPSLGLATDAGIYYGRRRDGEPANASGILIPVEAEDSSQDAYGLLTNQIDALIDDLDIDIDYLGLVVNKYDARKGIIFTSTLKAWQSLEEPPVVAIVHELKEQREAVRMRTPLISYAPGSDQAKSIEEIVDNLEKRVGN